MSQPIPDAHLRALKNFAALKPRGWKGRLLRCWELDLFPHRLHHEDRPLLRELRNTHGPSWLEAFPGIPGGARRLRR